MEVTRVSISTELVQREGGRLLGFGSVDIDHCLRIEFIRIVKTHDGRVIICMPSRVNSAGQHKDMVHPLNKELRQKIDQAVMSELLRTRPGDVQPRPRDTDL